MSAQLNFQMDSIDDAVDNVLGDAPEHVEGVPRLTISAPERTERAIKAAATRRDNLRVNEIAAHNKALQSCEDHFRFSIYTEALRKAGCSEEELQVMADDAHQLAHAVRTCAIKRAYHMKKNAKNAKKTEQKASNAAKQKVRSQAISKDKKKKSALALLNSLDPTQLAALLAGKLQPTVADPE